MKRGKSCKVVFFPDQGRGPSAAAMTKRGASFNVINYPKGARLTAREKLRARQALCGAKFGELAKLGIRGRRFSMGKR